MRNHRRIIGLSTLAALAMAACLIWGFIIEPRQLDVVVRATAIPGVPPLRIGLISDLHAGSRSIDEAKVRRCVAELNAGHPDLILLLGDYMNNGRAAGGAHIPDNLHIEQVADWLRDLHAPLGVFAALGNHDWWYDGPLVRRAFEQVGIRVLDDQSTRIDTPAGPFWLAGIADAMEAHPDPARVIGAISEAVPIIAFTHSPDVFPQIPARVALTLAGHTHGGQVRLPFVGPLVVPSNYGRRYARGFIDEAGHRLFVTSGVGTSILPVRFGVPPEIVFLDVNRPASNAP